MKLCLRVVLASIAILFATASFSDERNGGILRQIVSASSGTILKTAWPTAKYESVSFEGIEYLEDGVILKIKINAVSYWSEGPLWLEVFVTIKNRALADIRWGNHNGIIPPGFAAAAFAEIASVVADEFADQPANEPPPRFNVKNSCNQTIRLALHFQTVEGHWTIGAWWKFSPETSQYLVFGDGTTAVTNNEPRRVCRRLFCLSYAAMSDFSIAA